MRKANNARALAAGRVCAESSATSQAGQKHSVIYKNSHLIDLVVERGDVLRDRRRVDDVACAGLDLRLGGSRSVSAPRRQAPLWKPSDAAVRTAARPLVPIVSEYQREVPGPKMRACTKPC